MKWQSEEFFGMKHFCICFGKIQKTCQKGEGQIHWKMDVQNAVHLSRQQLFLEKVCNQKFTNIWKFWIHLVRIKMLSHFCMSGFVMSLHSQSCCFWPFAFALKWPICKRFHLHMSKAKVCFLKFPFFKVFQKFHFPSLQTLICQHCTCHFCWMDDQLKLSRDSWEKMEINHSSKLTKLQLISTEWIRNWKFHRVDFHSPLQLPNLWVICQQSQRAMQLTDAWNCLCWIVQWNHRISTQCICLVDCACHHALWIDWSGIKQFQSMFQSWQESVCENVWLNQSFQMQFWSNHFGDKLGPTHLNCGQSKLFCCKRKTSSVVQAATTGCVVLVIVAVFPFVAGWWQGLDTSQAHQLNDCNVSQWSTLVHASSNLGWQWQPWNLRLFLLFPRWDTWNVS